MVSYYLFVFLFAIIGEDKISSSGLDLALGAVSFISYLLYLINLLSVLSATCMSEVFWITQPQLSVSCACPSHYNGFKTKAYSSLTGRQ